MRYGSVPAVRGLDLAVERGELVGLIGPNGAGKSTTLHAIMGVVPRRRGDVRLAGRVDARPRAGGDRPRRDLARARGPADLRRALRRGEPPARARGPPPRRRRRHRSRRPTSSFRCWPSPRPPGGRALGRPAAAARDRARARRRARTCSCSTSLARALADRRRRGLRGARRRSGTRGVTILLVEQRAQRTVALADRTLVLANGELRMTLTPADAGDTEKMIAAYLA